MEKSITFYTKTGEIKEQTELTPKNLLNTHGMMVRCTLLDGGQKEGYANTFYCFETKEYVVNGKAEALGYIALETFPNIDEETHSFIGDGFKKYKVVKEKVLFANITRVEAILHSGLRWGGPPTNKFRLP